MTKHRRRAAGSGGVEGASIYREAESGEEGVRVRERERGSGAKGRARAVERLGGGWWGSRFFGLPVNPAPCGHRVPIPTIHTTGGPRGGRETMTLAAAAGRPRESTGGEASSGNEERIADCWASMKNLLRRQS